MSSVETSKRNLRVASLYITDNNKDVCTDDIDIICVQNINRKISQEVVQTLKHQGFLEIHIPSKTEGIFSKMKFNSKGYISFPRSREARGITWVKIEQSSSSIYVITSELDFGGEGSVYRRGQVDEMLKAFPIGSVVFAGNTNIPTWQKLEIDGAWKDGWTEMGTSKNEYTIGEDRLDRIWYKGLECLSFELRDERMVVCDLTY